MSKKNVDISKDGYNAILNQVLTNLNEERNLALDRYRTQDEMMQTPEDFVLQGKDVVSYLKLASERTNTLLQIANEVKELAYLEELKKNGGGSNNQSQGMTVDDRKAMEEIVKQMKGKDIKSIDEIKTEGLEEDNA